MKLKAVTEHAWFFPAVGAAVTMLCGFALHQMPIGEKWEEASYDYLFRFGTHATNNVVLITMDEPAYNELKQIRAPGHYWDRSLHTKLVNKLAGDQCPLVVFDVFFGSAGASTNDNALADAMRREGHVVLMEGATETQNAGKAVHEILTPQSIFVQSAMGMGIAEVDEALKRDPDQPPRRHYPFPPNTGISLAWAAATNFDPSLSLKPAERWLRYYGESGGWMTLSYPDALSKGPGFFSDKVVFIGQEPKEPNSNVPEPDKFHTPYTRWTGTQVGGVEVHATTFLNLLRGDWLRRVSGWNEVVLLGMAGLLLGGSLCLVRWPVACGIAATVFTGLLLGAVCLSFYTNYWFDWLTIAGGQLPVALGWAVAVPALRRKSLRDQTIVLRRPTIAPLSAGGNLARTEPPDAPDYQLCDIPFGSGAYGNVWLARNAIGQWQALKAVYLSGFGEHTGPYDREFNGISRYKPVSEKHSGLLRIDFISQKKPGGYFYYVMELGDSLEPGWEKEPELYRPRDLAAARKMAEGGRLPARECIRIVLALCEALEFLHSQGLTHRDIKPGNIIFVAGKPKLADVGLIAEIRQNLSEITWVGTPAYMPPPPEPPGTVQADIYGLGMVLYVILTGRDPEFFPGISTTLAEQGPAETFLPLNAIILKACQPDITQRYASAAEMQAGLLEVQRLLNQSPA